MRRPRRAPLLAAAVAALAFASPAVAGAARTLGIDVSRFEGRIVWERVAGSRVRFGFIQASRGDGDDCTVKPRRCGADRFYDRNYRLARQSGLRVGPYHRAFTNGDGRAAVIRDARAEADLFIAAVGELRAGDLRPVLDVETPFGGLSTWELRAWLRAWLERVRDALGPRPMIYTNVSSWQPTGDTATFARAGHSLWVANWEVRTPLVPAQRWDGRGWEVWQFTPSGEVPGIAGNVGKDWLRAGFARISLQRPGPRGGAGAAARGARAEGRSGAGWRAVGSYSR